VNVVLNNGDFNCFLKVGNELLSLSLLGRAFHTVSATMEKVYLPNSVRVHCSCSWRLSADYIERGDITGCRRVERYKYNHGVEVECSLCQ